MYPGAFIESQPDKPALIMAGSGFTQTFAELDAAANRLSRVLRDVGVAAGRPRRHLHGEPRPLLRGRLGLPLRRAPSTRHARAG